MGKLALPLYVSLESKCVTVLNTPAYCSHDSQSLSVHVDVFQNVLLQF
jgi:hypothetical protein